MQPVPKLERNYTKSVKDVLFYFSCVDEENKYKWQSWIQAREMRCLGTR